MTGQVWALLGVVVAASVAGVIRVAAEIGGLVGVTCSYNEEVS